MGVINVLGTEQEWRSACLKKARYATEEKAVKYKLRCEAKRDVQLRVYHCKWCQGFHLTKRELR